MTRFSRDAQATDGCFQSLEERTGGRSRSIGSTQLLSPIHWWIESEDAPFFEVFCLTITSVNSVEEIEIEGPRQLPHFISAKSPPCPAIWRRVGTHDASLPAVSTAASYTGCGSSLARSQRRCGERPLSSSVGVFIHAAMAYASRDPISVVKILNISRISACTSSSLGVNCHIG